MNTSMLEGDAGQVAIDTATEAAAHLNAAMRALQEMQDALSRMERHDFKAEMRDAERDIDDTRTTVLGIRRLTQVHLGLVSRES